ncbi:MAG: AAA family ATPase [Rhodocyclaceae bacterium]|nr:AAA family ATPase [Rhodocyclaceae bacterium]MCL4758353.1 AAA family ATPase [Rhodocyclaceae bacterium]
MKAECRVIALISQKGGAGKTTVAMQLAAGLVARGHTVAIADLDPQESAVRWAESASAEAPFPARVRALQGEGAALAKEVRKLARLASIVLLDCPPSIEHPHARAALDLADLALVPVVPSPPDLWSARAVERLILQTIAVRPQLRGAMLVNRAQRTALSGSVIEVLREFELPVLRAGFSQRNAFAQSAVIGGSVLDLGKAAESAQIELMRVVDAVLAEMEKGR